MTMERLQGKNQIRKFRQIAENLKAKIVSFAGVVGIIYTGGLTRGFTDDSSDIDIIVLLGKKDERLRKRIQNIGSEEQKHQRVDMDVEVHFLEDFKRRTWNETEKWDFAQAKTVFDATGDVRRLIKEKLRVSEGFWVRRIVVCGEYLKWYCCPPREGVGTIAETWIERGDLISAHYCLNYSLDLFIQTIFGLNKEFLPPPKWRIYYSYDLKWLPEDYKNLLTESFTVKSLSARDLKRRLKALRTLWREILPKMKEETGLTPELISKEYVKKVLRQG